MMGITKTRTSEQVSKKMINEERTIMDLELAIKKERFRNTLIEKPEFNEGCTNVTDTASQKPKLYSVCWRSNK